MIGVACAKGVNAYPCICKCDETDTCTWIKLMTVEKMTTTIRPKQTSIFHTNFPVSGNAVKNFRNPFTTVDFYPKRE